MRWLRENWLDFLIFLLIALVAAGIVLYLTGINPFARPRESASPMPGPSVTSSPPPSPDQPPKVEPAPQVPSPEAKPAPEPVVTVLPLPQAPAESKPAPQEKPTASPGGSPPSAPAPSAPASGGTYRVAVGAFADPGNAARLRQELVEKGYPARLEPAGNLTRVVVGPYTSEAEARRVAEVLASYGAQVYRGQGAPPPASSTLYLQVGAFQKEENALALASKLREMDLPVVLVKDGVYRVRIGPVAEEEKEALKAKVQALGLEALEVR
ncbi:sporulation protein [Thermus scotoductus]|uniref:Sporulation protein n=2 Tax=Thermus scotoductus TaxID=37636 RepID=A0A430SGQ5_THESC|nr:MULTISPECIES: SPOR domain-containing protein [Thermus]QWK22386.1 MAG: SPOR domain-containing protein [Thermus antranikianii]RTG92534.1 sporulation protein [Thermus scotoductus]RTH02286.1 sporulation protein [Thermus scotoductus]RTH03895.1 sporulation protein [Thermus scotoductus]RTH18279.1 sporulation protein [Thermus scotoductus]